MRKLFLKVKTDDRGFTLVELIVVILIIAILAVALAPQVMKYIQRSRISADLSNAASIKSAINVAYADWSTETGDKILPPQSFEVNGSITSGTVGALSKQFVNIMNGDYPRTKYDENGFKCSYSSTGSVSVTCGATFVS